MRLLLDECIGDRSLRDALVAAGHDVVRAVDALGGGADDEAVFEYARAENRTIVTYNNADFIALGQRLPEHAGLLLIYQENKLTDMTGSPIAKAVERVEQVFESGIAGETIVLNGYRW